jgi:hypothetical protein
MDGQSSASAGPHAGWSGVAPTAERDRADGAELILYGRNTAELGRIADQFAIRGASRHRTVTADLADLDQVRRMASWIRVSVDRLNVRVRTRRPPGRRRGLLGRWATGPRERALLCPLGRCANLRHHINQSVVGPHQTSPSGGRLTPPAGHEGGHFGTPPPAVAAAMIGDVDPVRSPRQILM